MASHGGSQAQQDRHVLVAFPGAPYTHESALRAAKRTLEPRGWVIHSKDAIGMTDEDTEKWTDEIASSNQASVLYLMDYDLLPFERIQAHAAGPSTSKAPTMASSYSIRKALIRKNWLHAAVNSYSVKRPAPAKHEGGLIERSPLEYLPRSWSIDVQFADDLDELLIDDLYDLGEDLQRNEERPSNSRRWYILKAAMADRGMGIRMFDSLDGLRSIMEEFEESDSEDEDADQSTEHGNGQVADAAHRDTSVMLSQLRHFVIQEYIQPPLLMAPNPVERPESFRKFHLRAYVLCVGGLNVYLWDEMLALFAPADFSAPGGAHKQEACIEDGEDSNEPTTKADPRVHLTNTCLHADGSETSDGRISQDNVHLLSDLCNQGCDYIGADGASRHRLGPQDLCEIRSLAQQTIGVVFEAVAKGSGSTNWLTWENCWEVFGVDLLVGYDVEKKQAQPPRESAQRRMWLLEVNAQPDFAQTGERLQKVIDDLFARSLEVGVVDRLQGAEARSDPEIADQGSSEAWKVGESKEGLTLCFSEKMRGAW